MYLKSCCLTLGTDLWHTVCINIYWSEDRWQQKTWGREGQGAAKHMPWEHYSVGSCVLFVRFSQTWLVVCICWKHFYIYIIIYWYKWCNCILIKCLHSHYVYSSWVKGVQWKVGCFVLDTDCILLYKHVWRSNKLYYKHFIDCMYI